MVYLVPFVVLVAGIVGCGYIKEGFICDKTFSSPLAEKDEGSQPAVDLICHVTVPDSNDAVVFNDQTIETMLEWIVFSDSTNPRKEALVNKTNISRKTPFYQLIKDEQDNMKKLNYLLLLEESSPQEVMNILIPREKVVDFVDAIERLIRQGKGVMERDILISNDLYIFDESTQNKPKTGMMFIVNIKTNLDNQNGKDAFKKGLESITQMKKDYEKKVAQNRNNVQTDAERELLTGACKVREAVGNDFFIITEFSGYVGKSAGLQ